MHRFRQLQSAKGLVCVLGLGMLAACASTTRESPLVQDAPVSRGDSPGREAALVFPGILQRELTLASGSLSERGDIGQPRYAWEHARNNRLQGDMGPSYGPIEAARIDYYDRQRSIHGRVHNDLLIRTRIRRFYPPSR